MQPTNHFKSYEKSKLGKSNRTKKLSSSELDKFNDFEEWFSKNINKKKIELFYRGTRKSELKKRIKKKYVLDINNPWMNYLFLFGEKSKAYTLQENYSERFFLMSIQDENKETFKYIFDKLHHLLQKQDNDAIRRFNKSNTDFKDYFLQKENKKIFIEEISRLTFFEKIKIRNYYLRVIHTCYELGEKNEFSYFIPTSTEKKEAQRFSKSENENDSIVILYWLPKPIDRFGLSLHITYEVSSLILERKLSLPTYFTEFYPRAKEFSCLGGLLINHIIGYLDGKDYNKLVINPHLLNQNFFNEETIEKGFKADDISRIVRNIEQHSIYKPFLLIDNRLFIS